MSADMGTEVELSLTVPESELRTARKTIQDGIGDVQVGVQTGTGAASRATGGGGGGGAAGRMQRRTFRWARQRTEDINDILAVLQDIEDKVGQGGGGGGGLLPRLPSLGGGLIGGGGALGALALGGVTVTAGMLIDKVADIGPEDVIDTTLEVGDILAEGAAFPITAAAIVGSGLAVTAKDVIKGDFPITTGDVVDTTIEAADILADTAAFPITATAIVASGLPVKKADVVDTTIGVADLIDDTIPLGVGAILASVPLFNAGTFLDNVLGDGFPIDPSAIVDGEGETGETGDPSGDPGGTGGGFTLPGGVGLGEALAVGGGAAGIFGALSILGGSSLGGPVGLGIGAAALLAGSGAVAADGGGSGGIFSGGGRRGFIGQATAAPGFDPSDTPTISPNFEIPENTEGDLAPGQIGRRDGQLVIGQQGGGTERVINVSVTDNKSIIVERDITDRELVTRLSDLGVSPERIKEIERKIDQAQRGTR